MNFEGKNYYNTLGVANDASEANIERARNRLKYEERVPYSEWDAIDEAYQVLSNSETRRAYDEYLKNKGIAPSSVDFVAPQQRKEAEESAKKPEEEPRKEAEEAAKKPEEEPRKEAEEAAEKPEEEPRKEAEEAAEESEEESRKEAEEAAKKPEEEPMPEYKPERAPKIESEAFKKFKLNLATIGGATAGVIGFALVALGTGGVLGVVPLAVGAIAGGFISRKIAKAISNLKLKKVAKSGKITKVKTRETQLLEEFRLKTKAQIDKLLKEPHNNYNLEISKIRYQNQIALLEQLIQMKQNESVRKGMYSDYKLKLTGLKLELKSYKDGLAEIERKISEYGEEQSLTKTNKSLVEVKAQIKAQTASEDSNSLKIRRLEIKEKALELSQKAKVRGKKLSSSITSKFKYAGLKAVNFVKNRYRNMMGVSLEDTGEMETGRSR